MIKINYDGRKFCPVETSSKGEVNRETVFTYRQDGNLVWAEYGGGDVVRGTLIANCDENGRLDMRCQHINTRGELMTGICNSVPERLPDGRLRLHEKWRWTCGDLSAGESIVDEI
jgi:hypothetical protein